MGHKCKFVDRLEIDDNGAIKRIVKAVNKKQADIDVIREDLDTGKTESRYVYFSRLAGYLVIYPGEELGYYYGNYKQEEQDFIDDGEYKMNITMSSTQMEWQDFERLIQVRPRYKYVLTKIYKIRPMFLMDWELIFRILRIWENHPECEFFITPDLFYLIVCKKIYSLNKQLQIKLIKYLNKFHKKIGEHQYKITTLIFGARHDIDPAMVSNIKLFETKNTKKVCNYLNKVKDWNYRIYSDYKTMLKNLNHDFNNDYWKFPKSIREAHDKVLEEKRQIEANREKERNEKLCKTVQRFQKLNVSFDGYKVFIANDVSQFQKASDELNQCLMYANYIDRVINQQCLIIMIWDVNDKPIATAELAYNKEVLQFYGDEHDRFNCNPNEEIQNVLNKFLSSIENVTFRKRRQIA